MTKNAVPDHLVAVPDHLVAVPDHLVAVHDLLDVDQDHLVDMTITFNTTESFMANPFIDEQFYPYSQFHNLVSPRYFQHQLIVIKF